MAENEKQTNKERLKDITGLYPQTHGTLLPERYH